MIDGYAYSKYCQACTFWGKKGKEDKTLIPKYNKWKDKHDCKKNFQESAGKMELSIAKILWSRSEKKTEVHSVCWGWRFISLQGSNQLE